MKLLFTLDYELFLGSRSGDVENCLIKPMRLYLDRVEQYGLRFTIFVDAAYLYILKQYAERYPTLRCDVEKVSAHLQELQRRGHDIQLHIHPQWYYSTFDGTEWQIDTNHYKLSDIPANEVKRLFKESKDLLDGIIGKKTTAFRAGGFSAQPTNLLTELFAENGLVLDSSVCPGAYYDSVYQNYDYRNCLQTALYRFDDDICVNRKDGRFVELPISMHGVSPQFHWRLVAVKLWSRFTKSTKHKTLGNGISVKTTGNSIINRLTHYCDTMATIDGFKISFLKDAIIRNSTAQRETMCILGHPKLATPYSVEKIEAICALSLIHI